MPQIRQLAAIMFTDIVGYTALMGNDEQKAFQILKKNRQLQRPLIEKYNGTWIKELGDGVLATFSTVTDAVLCAVAIQQACSETIDLKLKIGIDQSEVVFEDGDVFGDGVNIASRLQALAPVGGIWISESAHKNVVNKKEIRTRFVREETLKNVREPMRIYEITTKDAAIPLTHLQEVTHSSPARKSSAIHKNRKPLILVSIIFLVLVAAGVGYGLLGSRSGKQIESIAVMPFVNESGLADMEYLSDGMTETLINSLSKLKDLSVKARSSVFRYKGKDFDPQKVGDELSVQAILNGRVAQRGENILLSLDLVDVNTGNQIWGEKYNRKTTDLTLLQSEIAKDVSNKLHQQLTSSGQNVGKKHTTNSEAYQIYLRGLFHWNKRTGDDLKKAIDYFNQAKEMDPSFALAYAGLAVTYSVLPSNINMSKQEAAETHLKAKAAAKKALELDNTLAEAYAVLAGSKVVEWDFAGAENDFKRAIELNPNFATAYQWYSELLATLGRNDEALAEIKKAYELDPFSPAVNMNLGLRYLAFRQYAEAIDQFKKTIELAPDYPMPYYFLGMINLEMDKFEESLVFFSKADILMKLETPESAARKTSELRQALKSGGEKGYWRQVLQYDLDAYKKGGGSAVSVAGAYTELGENDRALEWLEKAFNERDRQLLYLKMDFTFDSIRSDPRFKDLLRRIGLPVD